LEQFFSGALSTLEYGLAFVLVLSVLVFIHEWGHYYIARRCGVKIDSFSIGFGPEIFGITDRAGTRWRFSIIPLGGYVKMHGDADPASIPSEAVERMTPQEREVSFFHKTVGQRSAIVFAGPAANFLFAILVFTVIFMTVGQTFTPPRISGIVPDTAAAQAGFKAGDLVLTVDDVQIERFEQIQKAIRINAGHEVLVTVERDGQVLTLPVTPTVRIIDDGFGGKGQIGVLGVYGPRSPARIDTVEPASFEAAAGLMAGDLIASVDGAPVNSATDVLDAIKGKAGQPVSMTVVRDVPEDVITAEQASPDLPWVTVVLTPEPFELPIDAAEEGTAQNKSVPEVVGSLPGLTWAALPNITRVYANPFHAVYRAVSETWSISASTFTAISQLISGDRSVKELGGPLKIARISGEVANQNVLSLLHFMVLLSINLGLINLLPVPVLDGGHLVFYGIEALRGRPVSIKAQEYSFRVGLALVLCLMIFATWNDLAQLFGIGA
jgi:regulator of sigma E protease